MKRLLLSLSALLAAMTIVLSPGLLLAQDTSTDNAEDSANVAESDQVEQTDAADAPGAADLAVDDISAAEEEEESSARFIPSEEISQDLGVSFPVDI